MHEQEHSAVGKQLPAGADARAGGAMGKQEPRDATGKQLPAGAADAHAGGAPGSKQPPLPARPPLATARLLGLGLLLTYSFLLNTLPWLSSIYAQPSFAYGGVLALTYPGLAVQLLMLPLGRRVPAWLRVRASIIVSIAILALLPVVAPLGSGAGLTLLVTSGVATAVLESSLFGSFSAYGSSVNGAVVAGQGLAGLVASIMAVCVKSAAADPSQATLVYCALGACVLLLCLAAHVRLALPAERELAEAAARGGEEDQAAGRAAGGAGGSDADAQAEGRQLHAPPPPPPDAQWAPTPQPGGDGGGALLQPPGARGPVDAGGATGSQWQRLHAVRQMTSPGGGGGGDGGASHGVFNPFSTSLEMSGLSSMPGGASTPRPLLDASEDGASSGRVELASLGHLRAAAQHAAAARARSSRAPLQLPPWAADLARVLLVMRNPAVALFLNFVATFLPFPGLLASIPYRGDVAGAGISLFLADGTWWFTVLLLVFSACDVAGRAAANAHGPVPEALLPAYALLRFAWTPLVAGCAFRWGASFDDALLVCVVAGFAFTNGHLATLCFRQGPQRAAPGDRELAGFALAAALHVGIVVGSNAALAFAG